MKNAIPDFPEEPEKLDEDEKLDHAFDEMEMLYRTRCGNIAPTDNVRVVEIEKTEKGDSEHENTPQRKP